MRTRRHNCLTYWLESLVIRLRDRIRSPAEVLREAGLEPGMTVLDFGCGPGGFSLAAARIVGAQGRVYALDVQPLARELVRRGAKRQRLGNVQVLDGAGAADIPARSVDLALLYDVLHIYPEPEPTREILLAIRRVLKPNGRLSVTDHHLDESRLVPMLTADGLFRLVGCTRRTLQFAQTQDPQELGQEKNNG